MPRRDVAGGQLGRVAFASLLAIVTLPALAGLGQQRALASALAAARSGESLGGAVAISGNLAVAAEACADNCAGAVTTYQRTSSGWHQQSVLKDPAGQGGNLFGWSVALSGSTLLVGAIDVGVGGAVYCYVHSDHGWRAQAKLAAPPSGSGGGDEFGASLAIAGSTALIGAPSAGANIGGRAYVYDRSGSIWRRAATLTDPSARDRHMRVGPDFGIAVGITGSIAVVGADFANRAYVFKRAGTAWQPQGELSPPHRPANSDFGNSVAISGTTIVVGAPGVDKHSGLSYVYVLRGKTWSVQQTLAASQSIPGHAFGLAVAIAGSRVLIGGPNQGGAVCGSAYEYQRSGTSWPERAELVNPRCAARDNFGAALALSGRTAIIGAQGWHGGAGAVYIARLPY